MSEQILTTSGVLDEVIIAGFGGQGVILSSKLLAQTATEEEKEVTLMPSYGAEVRGGTANCKIIIAEEPIASPVVTHPISVVAMSKASVTRFAPQIRRNGLLLINSSLVDIEPNCDKSVRVLKVPADDLALELGSPKYSNVIMLGAYLQLRGLLQVETAVRCIPLVLAKRYHHLLEANGNAIRRGATYAQENA